MIDGPDNPVWEALSGVQRNFNAGNESVRFFPPDVAPFVGMGSWDENDISELLRSMPADRIFSVMIAKQISLPPSLNIILSLPLFQMYCPKLIPFQIPGAASRSLTKDDLEQMLSLTSRTKPGPFFQRTIEFGNYQGIFENGNLVAMAGERLKTGQYTEVSAICTDRDHLGRGYASYLTSKVCEQIFLEEKIPFLHVRQDNARAIAVYKKLGFEIRAEVYFAIFKKA